MINASARSAAPDMTLARVTAVLLLVAALAGAEDSRPPALRDVAFDQRLGDRVPADIRLRDETGRTVRLGDYLGRSPSCLPWSTTTARCCVRSPGMVGQRPPRALVRQEPVGVDPAPPGFATRPPGKERDGAHGQATRGP